MSFKDIRFPDVLAWGSAGGPRYNTSVVKIKSGKEKRNANWDYPRIEFDVATAIQEMADLESLIAFFHIAQGMAYTFRFRDYSDYKSCQTAGTPLHSDQIIGTGDGDKVEFQLYKTYLYEGEGRLARRITKPTPGTVLVGVNGSEQTSGWTVDTTTGIVTFSSAPASGATITAGYEFDIEARFDTDSLSTSLEQYQLGSTQVPVIEDKG